MNPLHLILYSVAGLLIAGIVVACGMQKQNRYSSIIPTDVTTFKSIVQQSRIQLVDARTPQEYAEGHIEGAINIDVLAEDFTQSALRILKKGESIAIYCRSGKRSSKAAELLVAAGFQGKIYNLTGGYLAYTRAGSAR